MAVVLEGGCRVSTMHEGVPHVSGSLKVWNQIGRANGAEAISLRILEFGPGSSPVLRNRECDEVSYVLEDLEDETATAGCSVVIDGSSYEVGPRCGIYLRPGQTLHIENPERGRVTFVSSQCPEERFAATTEPVLDQPVESDPPIVRLEEPKGIADGRSLVSSAG